ncbi:MAG: hypothetical protein AB7P04_10020 [Bacteriovoracia bacterium]
MKAHRRRRPWIALWIVLAAASGCSRLSVNSLNASLNPREQISTPPRIQVSWNANREHAVNATGGGYRVHYSQATGFAVSGAPFVNVPYVSGAAAPTSAALPVLPAGTYYLKIVAYSAMNPSGVASAETSVVLP